MASDLLNKARLEFEEALRIHPDYRMAKLALAQIRVRIH
jgi:hypothetical protein